MVKLKFLGSVAVLIVWGATLLSVWITQRVPDWAVGGLRRVLMLDRGFEPTIFTLLFGLAFTGFALFGLVGMATGRGRFHQ